MITAFCERSGRIGFARGRAVPAGMMPLVEGPAPKVRALMGVVARHAHDNKALLVPGIPEATSDAAAYDALVKFSHWLEKRKDPDITVC